MPPAEASKPGATGTALIVVPDLRRIRITCVLRKEPRWKRLYWSAMRADVDPV
jgi:hypothetical protein